MYLIMFTFFPLSIERYKVGIESYEIYNIIKRNNKFSGGKGRTVKYSYKELLDKSFYKNRNKPKPEHIWSRLTVKFKSTCLL